jgi:ankyrin repeat protein
VRCLAYNTIRFLLARLHVDSLLDKRTKQKVLLTLKKLSRGLAALNEAYNDAIQRINGQLAEDRLLAKRAISWVSYAQRPLTTQELCQALAVEPGDRVLNLDSLYDVKDIISVCAGLVTLDKESNVVRLIHYTTQKYFELIRVDWNPGACQEIATTCLTYLTFDIFRSGPCNSRNGLLVRKKENVFIDYAARYWAEHVRPVEDLVSDLALNFLQDQSFASCATQIIYMPYTGSIPFNCSSTTGLHLSAMFGLISLSRMLVRVACNSSNVYIDSRGFWGRTPLFLAAQEGHEPVVKLLIDTEKVNINSKDMFGQTLLWKAAGQGHEAVVKLLIGMKNIDIESKSKSGQTILSRASEHGHDAVVKLLIDTNKVDVDSKDHQNMTPLLWAAQEGHEAVVKLLIETGDVDVDRKSNYGQTSLSYAAEYGHEAVVKLLIDTNQVEVDSKDHRNMTPLLWAAQTGEEAVIKLLMDTGKVDVNHKDRYEMTPLWWAVYGGHEPVVKLLVNTGKANVNSEDQFGRTPLSLATNAGNKAMVNLLKAYSSP